MGIYKIEICCCNVEKIFLVVEKVFVEKGYVGIFMGNIVEEVELLCFNLYYYFSIKDELYCDVFFGLFEVWKQDVFCFEMFDDLRVVLISYICVKMNYLCICLYGFKVWVNEIMYGVLLFGVIFDDSFYEWVKMKEVKICQWVEEKCILLIELSSLFYMIWVFIQYYVDFGYQVEVFNGYQLFSDMQFERVVQMVISVVLCGIGLEF